LPQNLQLIDIARTGEGARLLYDMPIGSGEPHYAQIIKADKLKCWEVYPEIGWDPHQQAKHPRGTTKASIRRSGHEVEVNMVALRSHYEPEHVEVKKGDRLKWAITNAEQTRDATHGFCIPSYNIAASIEPGETITMEIVADKEGVFPFYCLEFCSALHLEMTGYFIVEP
jgi:nitrous-oxide reductase